MFLSSYLDWLFQLFAVSDRAKAITNLEQPSALADVKRYALGRWESISVELRPTEDRTGTGKVTPTRLKREFTFLKDNRFNGVITMFGDDYGKLPLMKFEFSGETKWGSQHPILPGAWEIDYILNESFAITPLNPKAADMLNQMPVQGVYPFEAFVKQDILGKSFPLFNISEGQIVVDYDLIYFTHGMLFMGAKHVDGTPFDKPENRPSQLQIPLQRFYQ